MERKIIAIIGFFLAVASAAALLVSPLSSIFFLPAGGAIVCGVVYLLTKSKDKPPDFFQWLEEQRLLKK